METGIYRDESAIREVVEKFEHCVYTPEEFTHPRHLTVACWYLCTLPEDTALIRMRESLLRFTAHHGKQGYHETITRFWTILLAEHLRHKSPTMSIVRRINEIVPCYPKETVFDYYTRDRVMADSARREWVEPDLRVISEAAKAHQLWKSEI